MSTKVFVGNLAFRATDQDLQQHFGGFGEIKSAVIITRGRRSLGYGFVEFENLSEAEAAVNALNQTALNDLSFNGRAIKVEIAKDPAEREPRPVKEPKEPKEPKKPKVVTNPAPVEGGEEGEEKTKKKRTRKQRPRGKRTSGAGEAQNTTANPDNTPAGNDRDQEGQPKTKRVRKERPQREKVLSKTTLFVANLPFSLKDEELKSIFDGPGSGFVSARVVRTKNNRSRGYGFVEFESEEHQLNAMKDKENYSVQVTPQSQDGPDHRILAISISSSPAPDANNDQQEAQ